MSPMMKKVENTGRKAMARKRKPYKILPEDFFKEVETLKLLFNQLVNGDAPNRVVVVPSVSYGMATVARNLPRKGEIIVVDGQFPSNVYPWMRHQEEGFEVKVIEAPRAVDKGKEWNERILEAINKKTVLVSIGHVHWADGTLFQLAKIRERLDDVDALLAIDGAQSIGALPFDHQAIRADAIVCAGYKWLMGPYGIGLAYFGERFDEGVPLEENWINRLNSEDFSGLLNYEDNYREGAARYGVGEQSNFILVPMLIAAIKQLLAWQPARIQEYCETLMADAIFKSREMGFASEDPLYRSHHLFGLHLPSGIGRDHAMKVFKDKKVSVSFRGDIIRVSPHVYNDAKDAEKFLSALNSIVA